MSNLDLLPINIAGMASAGWEWDGAPDEFDPPVIPVVGFPNRASLTEAPMALGPSASNSVTSWAR